MSGETSILEMVTFRNGTLTKKCSLRRFNIIVATQQRILTLTLKTIKPMGRFNIIVATQQRILTLPLKTIKPMGFISVQEAALSIKENLSLVRGWEPFKISRVTSQLVNVT